MNRPQDYVVTSLENHLFFARIMKEHAFFLKVGLTPQGEKFSEEGEQLLRRLEEILSRAIPLSGGVVREKVLCSDEIVTDFTDCAERQTCELTGTTLNRELTARARQLQGRDKTDRMNVSQNLVRQVRQLNRDALAAVNCLIDFKEQILCCVANGNLFTVNYPLLIEHILREARLYRAHLMRLEGMNDNSRQELRDGELFWNQIMMEHALFIRGLLDPKEEDLIETAHNFSKDFKCLLETSAAANDRMLRSGSNALSLTKDFRDFKCAGLEGITNCKIRSIILPLLADHVLREANHYIRLLEE